MNRELWTGFVIWIQPKTFLGTLVGVLYDLYEGKFCLVNIECDIVQKEIEAFSVQHIVHFHYYFNRN